MAEQGFWEQLDRLVRECRIRIDRPKGTGHPRYPGLVYPLDYGYLEGTAGGDGEGIDVWLGGSSDQGVVAVAVTVDLDKRDLEVKLLLGCDPAERAIIWAFHNQGTQGTIILERKCDLLTHEKKER